MLRKILNFRVLYRATPLFSFAIHTKYPKINHSPLRGSICSEIKSILHMKKGGQYLPECQLCDIQKLMIFVSKWGVSLVRNIQFFNPLFSIRFFAGIINMIQIEVVINVLCFKIYFIFGIS